jgi:molybdopterin-synthase adenylyltransferase
LGYAVNAVEYSVAIPGEVDHALQVHLLRSDGQEDLCFALWTPSTGSMRQSAIINELILPESGDHAVHGNVSFNPPYFERAISIAMSKGKGLALLHSHPLRKGWQGMSEDDVNTERAISASTFAATELPLLGLTLSSDAKWSGRFWERVAPRTYERRWCRNVRVAGKKFDVTFNPLIARAASATDQQLRTVSSWGPSVQADLARLRFGIVGAGSVGGFIAEALARMGATSVTAIDFDIVKKHNLDRLCYATKSDFGHKKVVVLGERLASISTADSFEFQPVPHSVAEPEGLAAALDCDILFCCVDRPWGRHILNQIAFSHLIPVIDGGISIRVGKDLTMKAADWRSHIAAVGRKCLCCIGQYSTGMVQSEREGLLDDQNYISGLPDGHPYKASENVFAFSMACASDMMLQFLAHFVAPLGYSDMGARVSHFVGGRDDEPDFGGCLPTCGFHAAMGDGDNVVIC